MTEHTEGPWATDGRDSAWDILAPNDTRIASVWRLRAKGAADARLISAAPDLLAALENMVAHFPFWASKMDMTQIDRDAVALARAAITKAKGA